MKKIIKEGRQLLEGIKKTVKETVEKSVREMLRWLEKKPLAIQTREQMENGLETVEKERIETEGTIACMEKEVDEGKERFKKLKGERAKAMSTIERIDKEMKSLYEKEESGGTPGRNHRRHAGGIGKGAECKVFLRGCRERIEEAGRGASWKPRSANTKASSSAINTNGTRRRKIRCETSCKETAPRRDEEKGRR